MMCVLQGESFPQPVFSPGPDIDPDALQAKMEKFYRATESSCAKLAGVAQDIHGVKA